MTRYNPKPVSIPLDEDDIDFDITNGHDHDGTDSKLIDAAEQMVIYEDGTQVNHEDIEKLNFQDPLTAVWSEPSKQVNIGVQNNLCVIESGSFVGNSTPNRAIPHGLSRTPKMINISLRTADARLYHYGLNDGSQIKFLYYNSQTSLSITPWNTTNFYVGNSTNYNTSANMSLSIYDWVAFG